MNEYSEKELQKLEKLGSAFSETLGIFFSDNGTSLSELVANIKLAMESDDIKFVQEVDGDVELLARCSGMLREVRPDGFRFLIENLENINTELLDRLVTLKLEQEW